MAVRAPFEDVQRVVGLALDAAFYRAIYEDIGADDDALLHYFHEGWRDGRDPAPWFSTRRYLAANPDIAGEGLEPLHHFLTHGRGEGRSAYPSEHATRYFTAAIRRGESLSWSAHELIAPPDAWTTPAPPRAPVVVDADERALVAPEFDVAYYRGRYPGMAASDAEAVDHFLAIGWREGRDPDPRFSVRDYLELNPDVAQAGVNPFVHYLRAGRAEGRRPRHDLGFRYEILADLVPLEQRVLKASKATTRTGSVAELRQVLRNSRTGLADLHITFSHDDYGRNLGGVQFCLQHEDAAVATLGRDHLHIYPAVAWPVVRQDEPGALGAVWNGRPAGIFSAGTIAEALRDATGRARAGARSFAIHSLLGHSAEETLNILAAVGLKSGFFWLHDFASLCAGFHLLRNDVEDCAAPPPESAACGVCAYGPWRRRHLATHEKLFEALNLTVVSPSQTTLDLWRKAARYPVQAEVVLPHAKLVRRGTAPAPTDGRFRLAFAGMPVAHKGWPVFRDLALRFGDDPRYEFWHMGGRTIEGLPIRHEAVSVTAARPKAMQEALAAACVDAVLIWPLCRETFSFTAHEAVAAGAVVLTNPDSGNVAAFATDGAFGRVLADEEALKELLQSGGALELARARRNPSLYDLAFSNVTADLLHGKAGA